MKITIELETKQEEEYFKGQEVSFPIVHRDVSEFALCGTSLAGILRRTVGEANILVGLLETTKLDILDNKRNG